MKYICQNCGREYEVDESLGLWQKDGSQLLSTKIGVSPKKYCCYECGKQDRKKKCQQAYKNKSEEELKDIHARSMTNRPLRKCVVCGKEFQFTGGTVPICSDECRKKRFHNIPNSSIRVCQNCGKEYEYIENQGSWNKDNQLVHVTGLGHEHVYKSQNFCCYECGKEHKEKLRSETNIKKYGYISPFENVVMRAEMYEKLKGKGELYTSKGERELRDFIESLGFKTDRYLMGNGLSAGSKRFEIDIMIPEKKIGIEYNGAYFHSINGKKKGKITTNYHFEKSKFAQENGIELIHVWEDQWLNQKDIVKDIIKARLGVVEKQNCIYARKCTIKEIGTPEYKKFCEKNHIQGYRPAKIKLGLFYNNKLVQIASFSKVQNMGKAVNQNKKYNYNWVRGCIASNNKVIGGTSKLFKYFVKNYNPESILCYADWNLFNGNGYKESGFTLEGYTGPDKFYVNLKPIYRINRNPYKYRELKQKVLDGKLLECYGAGSLKFVWKK